MKKMYLVLVAITLLAAVLRFYKLGEIPKGFHRDEAFLGYNAYSILKTGKDMSGEFLPVHFRSFLYSPSGYSYFAAPFIAIFGLNEFSVRFASALFGALTILPLFAFVQLILNRKVAIFASLFFAISPWSINLSRVATENSIVVFFILLGSYFYAKWPRAKTLRYFVLSFLSFFLTLFLYQAPRIFVPGFLILLLSLTWKYLTHRQKNIGLIGIVCIVLVVIGIFLSPNRALRAQTVSIFGNGQTQLVLDEQLREDGVQGITRMITRAIHNKPFGYLSAFAGNYFSHWTYDFLFTDKGLPDRYRVPGSGLLYVVELPLLLLGAYWLIRNNKKGAFFVIGWALIGPLGSSLAFDDVPNLQRTLFSYPALAILSAYGISKIRNRRYAYLITGFFIITFLFYLHSYYVHQIVHRPWYRQEGYKELVTKVNELKKNYHKVVITNHESSPGIFFLFYNNINPAYFQIIVKEKSPKDFDRVNIDQYEFPEDPCPLNLTKIPVPNALYINHSTCEIPKEAKIIEEIKRNDASVVFRILAVQK